MFRYRIESPNARTWTPYRRTWQLARRDLLAAEPNARTYAALHTRITLYRDGDPQPVAVARLEQGEPFRRQADA